MDLDMNSSPFAMPASGITIKYYMQVNQVTSVEAGHYINSRYCSLASKLAMNGEIKKTLDVLRSLSYPLVELLVYIIAIVEIWRCAIHHPSGCNYDVVLLSFLKDIMFRASSFVRRNRMVFCFVDFAGDATPFCASIELKKTEHDYLRLVDGHGKV